MNKKIAQIVLSALFLTLSAFSGSALAICVLSADGGNQTSHNFALVGIDGLPATSQAIYNSALAAANAPPPDLEPEPSAIAAACAAEREFIFAENEYSCATSASNRVWLDRNLGASAVCPDDAATEHSACYGDLYQWGRGADGHERRGSGLNSDRISYATTDSASFITVTGDWATDDSDRALRSEFWKITDGTGVCPAGFRVPTLAELGVERLTWRTSGDPEGATAADAYASSLKWPLAGERLPADNGRIQLGNNGSIWSTATSRPNYLVFFAGGHFISSAANLADGYSLRCIQHIE